MTNYLIRNGHRRIAYVGNIYSTSSIQDRYLGYYKSLLEHGMQLDHSLILSDRDDKGKFIDIALPDPLPTAFVCNCDQIAYLLVDKLKLNGYSIPEDCSVVGFDNDIYATLTSPQLTTVEVDIEQMAKSAVKFIMDKIENPHRKFGRVMVQGNIIYRQSARQIDAEAREITST